MADTTSDTTLPKLVDARQLADRLGLREGRVYQLARRGAIPCVRIPGCRTVRFDVSAVADALGLGGR